MTLKEVSLLLGKDEKTIYFGQFGLKYFFIPIKFSNFARNFVERKMRNGQILNAHCKRYTYIK